MPLTPYEFEPDPSLFNKHAFRQELSNARSAITLFKQAIQTAQGKLNQRFMDGADIRDLVHGRAWFIDQLLSVAWEQYEWPDNNVSLLAVGGYGRGELHPHSDIDLLILLRDDDDTPYRENLQQFVTFLWDISLDIGHSVRSLSDCEREAKADITVATNLLENRTIIGPDSLRVEMVHRLDTDKMWSSSEFFEAKWQEQITRHYKYNNNVYNLEPNIKSSPGGLRDIQMIGWVAKRHFGTHTLEGLMKEGFLTESEVRIMEQGQAFLWQVRYALHMTAKRAEDRLLFDHQRTLAELFGYVDNDERLAVEQFMRRYYRVVMSLTELNDVLMQHFDDAILQSQHVAEIVPLNKRFQIVNRKIEATHSRVFEQTPFALLEIFLLMAENPQIESVRASTIRLLRDCRHLIDESFRQDIRHSSLFMELLRSPNNVARQLRRMSRYGILGKYLPEFGYAIGLMQHDLFHIYTVDAHTLLLLKFLHKFQKEEARKEFPFAAQIIHRLPKPELAIIAGLYHDIGKGRGGDHSELGAKDALVFCERHHLSKYDARLVSWLVEHHLLMSVTAQKKDISDPEIIQEFALIVRDEARLNYLYVLTVADINATNPNLWNSWRATLLQQLYVETKRALRRGLENPVEREEWIEETQKDALALLHKWGVEETKIWPLWNTLGEDYFLQDTAREIAFQTEQILQHKDPNLPLVLVTNPNKVEQVGGTKVFIYTQEEPHLFAATVAAMEQLNLNIHDARISSSSNNYSLDTYIVLEHNGEPIRDPERIKQIKEILIEELDDPADYSDIVQRRTPRQMKHFTMPTQVTISTDPQTQRTLLEVLTPDRPGLLARIGRIFVEMDINLLNSKIVTLGERVEDIFVITDRHLKAISDPELCRQLQDRICSELDEQVTKGQ
ncbi:[protein-PII] uridylyltransferase [Oceanospirillum beijerinckii]|uniref:[protein-PII] uridylyltransferase n=1 Tax=Oceanospirillum beijerinckii TaxID=64976 RepID=UPI0004193FD0|nr:[protein-PII] uridylyltransferase [Oceanospirillum beijerinckii]